MRSHPRQSERKVPPSPSFELGLRKVAKSNINTNMYMYILRIYRNCRRDIPYTGNIYD